MSSGQLNSIYRGVVTNNLDPEGFGRLKAVVPQVFGNDTTETDWAWPCYPPGVAGVLNPGAPVLVQFIDGDIDYPVWAGTWLPGYVAPIGPTSPGAIANIQVPVGASMDWWSNNLPPKIPQITWAFMHGQTIANAVNDYPQLWAVYGDQPGWSTTPPNGRDIVLPNTQGYFFQAAVGTDAGIGPAPPGTPVVNQTGGQNTPTLTPAMIPAFSSALSGAPKITVSTGVTLNNLSHQHGNLSEPSTPSYTQAWGRTGSEWTGGTGQMHGHPYWYAVNVTAGLSPGGSNYTWGTVQTGKGDTDLETIPHQHLIGVDPMSGASASGSTSVSFGAASPTPIPKPLWMACHKILRIA